MAKDPAFLFYSSDFLTGTMMMTDEQVGKYIRLMCLQHQKGHLSEKHMLSICKAYDVEIFDKFIKDEQGMYYNERLEAEVGKRRKYTESRRINALHPKNQKNNNEAYAQHMENENENINEDVNSIKVTKTAKSEKPDELEVANYFMEIGLDDFTAQAQAKLYINHYTSNGWKVGKNSMKDWRAAARGWKERIKTYKNGTHQPILNGSKPEKLGRSERNDIARANY
jgi:hypothetical protein